MRKVILQEFVSVDGLAAGPDDSVDFVPKATQMTFLEARTFDRGAVLLKYRAQPSTREPRRQLTAVY